MKAWWDSCCGCFWTIVVKRYLILCRPPLHYPARRGCSNNAAASSSVGSMRLTLGACEHAATFSATMSLENVQRRLSDGDVKEQYVEK